MIAFQQSIPHFIRERLRISHLFAYEVERNAFMQSATTTAPLDAAVPFALQNAAHIR